MRYIFLTFIFLFSTLSFADISNSVVLTDENNAIIKKIKQKVQQNFPQITINEIKPSIAGLYEVTTGSMVLYASGDGRYLFLGEILDMDDEKKNVTENARKSRREEVLKKIPSNFFISYKAQNEKYRIVIFTDPTCGYCKKLHYEINKLNSLGVTVNYMAFPRGAVDTKPYDLTKKVWCSSNKRQAMEQAMEDKATGSSTCNTSIIERSLEIGKDISVNATPTILLEDGTMIPGYMTADRIFEVIEEYMA